MIYGLINITTKYQNPEYQCRIIKEKYPEAEIDEDRDITTLLSICKEKDTIIIQNITKLCDSDVTENNIDTAFTEILEKYQLIFNKGIDIVVLEQPHLDSRVYKDAILSYNDIKGNAAGAVSQVLEKQIYISVMQYAHNKTSIKNSIKNQTRKFPTNKGVRMITAKERKSKEYIKTHLIDFGGDMTNQEVMSALGIARNTFFKYKKELLQESDIAESEKKEQESSLIKEKGKEPKYGVQTSITDYL